MFPENLGQIAILEIEKMSHSWGGLVATGQKGRGYPGTRLHVCKLDSALLKAVKFGPRYTGSG